MAKLEKSELVVAIKEYLRVLESRGLLSFSRNNEIRRTVRAKRAVYSLFGKLGKPEFYLFLRGGKTIHMYVPKRYRTLSKAQKAYKINIESLGHIYAEVRSIQDVETVIKRYLL